jgi:hypothetical protein
MNPFNSPKTPDPFVLIASLILVVGAYAQEPAEQPDENDQKARLRAAEEHVAKIDVRLAGAGGDAVKRIERPLLIYGDSARNNADGTLWAWGDAGRPLAVLETYHHTKSGGMRVNVLTLTGSQLVVAKTPTTSATLWQPQQAQVEPAPFPDAPPPSERQTVRLRQLKEMARRLTAHEFWDPDNSRFELRLLVQPVHRYADPEAKLHDGAIFVLAHGTNPEVLVLIEAQGDSLETARWHYSLARVGSAELHVAIDGKEVWKRDRTPGVVGRPTDPYWLFMTSAPPAEARPARDP